MGTLEHAKVICATERLTKLIFSIYGRIGLLLHNEREAMNHPRPSDAAELTRPSFCTTASERVYITATDCEIKMDGTKGLQAAGAGGL